MSANRKNAKASPGSETSGKTPAVVRRRGFFRLWMLAGLLLASVALGPSVASRVPQVRDRVVEALAPAVDGTLTVTAATADWWSPLSLRGIELRDREAKVIVAVPEIASEAPLWRLAIAMGSSMRFKCSKPQVSIAVRDRGSDLEDVLAPMLKQESEGGNAAPIALEVIDGTVELDDPEHSRRALLSNLNFKFSRTSNQQIEVELNSSAQTDTDDSPGEVHLELQLQPKEGAAGGESYVGRFHAKDVDLQLLEPILTRLQGGGTVTGALDSDLQFDWETGAAPVGSITGNAAIRGASLSGPFLAAGDVLRSETVTWDGTIQSRDGTLTMDRFELRSDFGEGDITGTIELPAGPKADVTEDRGTGRSRIRLSDANVQGTVRIDLVRLFAAIPRTIHLREGVEITSGELRGEFRTGEVQGAPALKATAVVQDLAGTRDGQPISELPPVGMKLTAHEADPGIVVDEILCRLDWLQASAAGDVHQGSFKVRCDLDRLTQQLDDVVDLAGTSLKGKLSLDGKWQLRDSGRIEGETNGVAERLVVVIPGRRELREDRLELLANVDASLKRVESASLRIAGAGDEFVARLLEPVNLESDNPTWPIDLRLTGGIATWLARSPVGIVPADWQVAGKITGQTRIDMSPKQVAVDSLRADLESLSIRGADWQADEPLAKLEGDAVWNSAGQQLDVPNLTLTARTLAARCQSLRWKSSAEGLTEAAGLVAIQADLSRVARWLPASTHSEWGTPSGVMTGKFRLADNNGRLEFSADVDSPDFALQKGSSPAGRTGADGASASATPLAVAVAGTWDGPGDLLQLDRCQVKALGNSCDIKGRISRVRSQQVADLSGSLTYDMESIASRFFPQVQIVGKGSHELSLRGPLRVAGETVPVRAVSTRRNSAGDRGSAGAAPVVSSDLQGTAGVGWSKALAYGVKVGAGELDLKLIDGILRAAPLELGVDQGRIHLAPQFLLNQNPLLLVQDEGPLVDHVHLTPELCSTWLKYVAPLLADITESDGTFSVDLSKLALPVSDPKQGDIAGTLKIHGAGVRPGGFALQLISVGRQIEAVVRRTAPRPARETASTVLDLPEQSVPFRMVQGRISHENFQMQVGDLAIRTSGSAGLDDSLDLVADVLIPEDWVARDRYLKKLAGRTLRIPIRGTIRKPQIDSRAVSGLAEQIAGSAAESAVEGLLEQQLKRLIPGK